MEFRRLKMDQRRWTIDSLKSRKLSGLKISVLMDVEIEI
jgi:hypothetical protein